MKNIGVAVALAVALGLAGTATPARAAGADAAAPAGVTAREDCPPGRMCVWSGANYQGNRAQIPAVRPGNCATPFLGMPSITYRSAYNRTSAAQRLWSNSNCSGATYALSPGASISDISGLGWLGRSVGGYP